VTVPLSESLREFVAEMPWERSSIVAWVERAARALPPGARVLDVGAGDAPYRELFEHVDYVTSDWSESVHEGAARSDIVAPADALPVDDAGFDAVLLIQVLEHVPEPAAVLAELRRVLRPGGTLTLTAPLVWELHEMPHDYFRYTAPGLEHLLAAAGFESIVVEARNDGFTTLAQLMTNVSWTLGHAPDGLDERRREAGKLLRALAGELVELAPLDTGWSLPLGFRATAKRPA
jgi:ubiquinone/menaquinone biosynthesis C-methylase UbiE